MTKDITLIIWLKNGDTCKFEKVKELREAHDEITFEYFGVSTKVERKATFIKENIAGFSVGK